MSFRASYESFLTSARAYARASFEKTGFFLTLRGSNWKISILNFGDWMCSLEPYLAKFASGFIRVFNMARGYFI